MKRMLKFFFTYVFLEVVKVKQIIYTYNFKKSAKFVLGNSVNRYMPQLFPAKRKRQNSIPHLLSHLFPQDQLQ